MISAPSPSKARMINNLEDKENLGGVTMSRSGSFGLRTAGKFSSNSSLSIAIHPPSRSGTMQFRNFGNIALPPTPSTAGLDSFSGIDSKSPSPALRTIELPLTPTSAGSPAYTPVSTSSNGIPLPTTTPELQAIEFDQQPDAYVPIPNAPKLGPCEEGVFASFACSSSSSSLDLYDFPPTLSDAEESLLRDDIDEDDDEHEAQTPVKDVLAMVRSSNFGGAEMMFGGASMQREATVTLVSSEAQLEMQSSFQRRRDQITMSMDKGKAPARLADDDNIDADTTASGIMLTSHFGRLALQDNATVPISPDNGLGLTLGPISDPASMALAEAVTTIVIEAPEGLPQVPGLAGLGLTLEADSNESNSIKSAKIADKSSRRFKGLPGKQKQQPEVAVENITPWQEELELSMTRKRAPLSESRRSSNATATPLSVVTVNRPRLGGLTPTSSPTTNTPLKGSNPSSPAKRSATVAALSSQLQLFAAGKENQDPMTSRRSSLMASGGAGNNSSPATNMLKMHGKHGSSRGSSSSSSSGSLAASSSGGEFGPALHQAHPARKRSRIALR